MKSPHKGTRITMCCALLIMYTMFVMEVGRNLITRFTTSPSSSPSRLKLELETQSNDYIRRNLRDSLPKEHKNINAMNRQGNDFIHQFEDALLGTSASTNFAAFILKEDKVYCRKSQLKNLSRARYFVQMLQQGIRQHNPQINTTQFTNGFPVLIKHDDSNGCYPSTQRDKYGFPRLTWSVPANTTSNSNGAFSSWCSAIGMPSYKTWKDLKIGGKGTKHNSQKNLETLYPWKTKIPKAVWRGSTTCNKGMYGHLQLQDIPRSEVVKSSLERPDLIDAGFHKLVGKYHDEAGAALEESSGRMLKEPIPLDDMMMYKAIIDIDGNNWSARFRSLLCTNSVIIKIAPDFIEQYYHELEPDMHYIPANLANLTQVVEYTMDQSNDAKVKGVVERANEWCRSGRNKESLATKAMEALKHYRNALDRYAIRGNNFRWEGRSVLESVHDLVECNV